MSAKTEISREMGLDLLDRRQQHKQREALKELRRHLAHAVGEMSVAAQVPGLYAVNCAILVDRFKYLDKIAGDALADSGILDAATKEEAGRIVDENERLRLLVHAGDLLLRHHPPHDDAEFSADVQEWHHAARGVLGLALGPPIPVAGGRAAAREWTEEARTRTFRAELEKTASDVVRERDVLLGGLRKIVATDPPREHPELDVRTCDLRGIAREALCNAGYTPSGEEK